MSSFGGTVKLTGESEYKKALKDITSNLKVLSSEMKVVTSQYDKSDKSTENLTKQNEVLNKQIEEQKKKVSTLAQALEESKRETGETSETTKKWQTELNNAQAELNKLEKKVDDNNKTMQEAEENFEDVDKAMDDYSESAEDASESSSRLGDIIKGSLIADGIKAGITALVDGVKSLGSAFTSAISGGAEYADTILTLATQTGLSTDTLEKYNAVAELTDVSLDTLTSSMSKNIKSMSAGKDAYEQLGVKVEDSNGKLRDSETVYWETIDALSGIENETERNALAMEIFGKSSQDLNTIIEMGSEGVKEYTDKAEAMGAVLGGKGLEALGNLDDQFQIFKATTQSTGNILASSFAPALADMTGGLNDVAGSFNGLISAVLSGGDIGEARVALMDTVDSLIESVSDLAPQLVDIASELISNVVTVIGQNENKLITAVTDIIGSLTNAIFDNLPEIIRVGADILMSLVDGISQNLSTLIPAATECILTIVSYLTDGEMIGYLVDTALQLILALAEGLIGALPVLTEQIPIIVDNIVTAILDNLPYILEVGIEIILALVEGIIATVPDLLDKVPEIIDNLVTSLTEELPKILSMGIDLLIELADGIIKALPQLIEKAPVIITKLITAITQNLPQILAMGVKLIVELASGLIKAIPQLVSNIPQIITAIVNGLKNGLTSLVSVGKNLVSGIWDGISNSLSWIKSKIQGWVGNVTSFIKNLFGIHSPSKLFKDEIGTNLALGIGEGFSDTMSDVEEDMANAIPTTFDTAVELASPSLMQSASGTSAFSYDGIVDAVIEGLKSVRIEMSEREMGTFIEKTVRRAVYA